MYFPDEALDINRSITENMHSIILILWKQASLTNGKNWPILCRKTQQSFGCLIGISIEHELYLVWL